MSSELTGASARPAHPWVLTLSAAVGVAICIALGVWQVQRAAWKTQVLAEMAARQAAGPQPIGPVLTRAAKGEDVSFTRVTAVCFSWPPGPAEVRMTTDRGDWIARIVSPCHLRAGPYDGLVVDRGFLAVSRGEPNPPPVGLPAPGTVSGLLFARPDAGAAGLAHPAPYVLVTEHETPAHGGLTPAPYPDPAENLEYVGAYAPTWFGLAAVIAGVYAAMLWRRRRSP